MKIPSRDEQAAALSQAPPNRIPEKATIKLRGDRGALVELPCILGNPSGACRLPEGEKPSPAWNQTVAIVLGISKSDPNAPNFNDQFALDCLLWPGRDVVSQWKTRWPAMAGNVGDAALRKMGYGAGRVEEPEGASPEIIAKALEGRPAACWRIVNARSRRIDIVIDPPKETTWRLFVEAAQKPRADTWKFVREMLATSIPIAAEDGIPVVFDDVCDRFPGAALMVMLSVSGLAGSSAEVELGE